MTDYYSIESKEIEFQEATFRLFLVRDCEVYKGHFPKHAIAPGACNIEMIRQCASVALGKEVRFLHIKQCKFLLPLEPSVHEELDLCLTWTETMINAVMSWKGQVALKLKVNM